MIYLIGSLRNTEIGPIATRLRAEGFDVFDDWRSPGPTTDDEWMEYEKARGRTYGEAIYGHHARNVFEFDKTHLDRADAAVLVLPAGRSAHIELGYIIGKGRLGYVLFPEEPERYDIMYQFADGVYFHLDQLIEQLRRSCERK